MKFRGLKYTNYLNYVIVYIRSSFSFTRTITKIGSKNDTPKGNKTRPIIPPNGYIILVLIVCGNARTPCVMVALAYDEFIARRSEEPRRAT
jgi:hypothetical protein